MLIHRKRAFTLTELLIAIAVMAILLTLGVPSLQNLIRENRVAAQANELSALISYTRSQATQGIPEIQLALDVTDSEWSGEVTDSGCGADACVLRSTNNSDVILTADRSLADPLVFDNRGILTSGAITLTLEHDPCTSVRQRRIVEVLVSGNVRVSAEDCQG